MTGDEFKARFGFEPEQDDLDRVNCSRVGGIGHYQCGMCPKHDRPRFSCGCIEALPSDSGESP